MIKYLLEFQKDISKLDIPSKFTYPFYYTPGKLMLTAVKEVQVLLESKKFKHNFGIDKTKSTPIIGKMFGVLVVKTVKGKLGILTTHSGEIQDLNDFDLFVPSIIDDTSLNQKKEESRQQVNQINDEILSINENQKYKELINQKFKLKSSNLETLNLFKQNAKKAKIVRSIKRKNLDHDKKNDEELSELIRESLHFKHELKVLVKLIKESEDTFKITLSSFEDKILNLEKERKKILRELQTFELDQYQFINKNQKTKSLVHIFNEYASFKPPAGTGNCSAPKLLQYAYSNNLHPVAMAEFWWGSPHKSEIKRHKHYYPACTSRCKPILSHMLQGLEVEENMLLVNDAKDYQIQIIYEDDYLLIINKPAGLLSVPGKSILDSVATRMKTLYPQSTGPLVVHRLDQETSGIMLIAKEESIYKSLQKQFIDRTIKKKYTAILNDKINISSGVIDLPLRGDFNNRPYQLVCEKNGKQAKTNFKVLEENKNHTRIEFEPRTGRTHQLRIHAAHFRGLNAPIIGDTLYGEKAGRLMLHASWIKFLHPITKKNLEFNSTADF